MDCGGEGDRCLCAKEVLSERLGVIPEGIPMITAEMILTKRQKIAHCSRWE